MKISGAKFFIRNQGVYYRMIKCEAVKYYFKSHCYKLKNPVLQFEDMILKILKLSRLDFELLCVQEMKLCQ